MRNIQSYKLVSPDFDVCPTNTRNVFVHLYNACLVVDTWKTGRRRVSRPTPGTDDLRKILHGGQRMAKVHSGE